jgi:hypothetical protein
MKCLSGLMLFFSGVSLNMRARQPNYGFYGSKQHRTVGRESSSFYNPDKRSFFGFINRREVSVPIEVRKCSRQAWLYSAAAAILKDSFQISPATETDEQAINSSEQMHSCRRVRELGLN